MTLDAIEARILRNLLAGVPLGPVIDRREDRARQRLRRDHLIEFDRELWQWRITDAGRALWIMDHPA